MKKVECITGSVVVLFFGLLFTATAVAATAEIYFSVDRNGQDKVTNVQEGQEVWICVNDPDHNADCDVRDKIAPDLKVMDPNTGAYVVWNPDPNFNPMHPTGDYLEETGADTGLFVSHRPFQIGTRESYSSNEQYKFTHVVGLLDGAGNPCTFQWGHYLYKSGHRGWFAPGPSFTEGLMPDASDNPVMPSSWKDSTLADTYIIGRFENNDTLVEVYQDPNDPRDVTVSMAKILKTKAEIAWDKGVYKDYRETATITVTDPDENLSSSKVEYVPVFIIVNGFKSFSSLKSSGGVDPATGNNLNQPIRWYNIYNSGLSGSAHYPNNNQPQSEGAYYLKYKTSGSGAFDTTDPNGYCRVMFYAQETGVNTGVFQLNINDIGTDLGFDSLKVHDKLVAYYLDPNDAGDSSNATTYIESPPYTGSSCITSKTENLGDDVAPAANTIASADVYDGSKTSMYFLDRQGNRVSGYVNSDCVFIEVVDPNQNKDSHRSERIDAYWDGGENIPFGPQALNDFGCNFNPTQRNSVNALLGDTNIFHDSPASSAAGQLGSGVDHAGWAKIYILSPRNGRWAAVDLFETSMGSGDFISTRCARLTSQYPCTPTLGVKPGDTIIAVYQDPSHYSDSAWISIKVGIGGGGTPPEQASTTMFVDAEGNAVQTYTDAESVYVEVIDPSHANTAVLSGLKVGGKDYELHKFNNLAGVFITDPISQADLGVGADDTITASYTDPTNPTDISSDTISIVVSVLTITDFYAAPNPFSDAVSFAYHGTTAIASTFLIRIYNLSGNLVWSDKETNVTEVIWDGTDASGTKLANGGYIYMVQVNQGGNTFSGVGTVFIDR